MQYLRMIRYILIDVKHRHKYKDLQVCRFKCDLGVGVQKGIIR
jgi:hypothetical protein